MLIAVSEHGLCAVLLGDDPVAMKRELSRRFPKATFLEGDATFERRIKDIVRFVDGTKQTFSLAFDVHGTPFQRSVWKALLKIPHGKTATYADIARALKKPAAVRAVAQACSANHLAVAIPCHRVVRSDGSLGGYRWGIARKKALLEREAKVQ